MEHNFDKTILENFGANGKILEELLGYCSHTFSKYDIRKRQDNDGLHISAYENYEIAAKRSGAFKVLSEHLGQLQFPVEKGMSQNESYRQVVLKGKQGVAMNIGPQLISPDEITLEVCRNELIGKVPVIFVPERSDFEIIVCALAYKNEPVKIPLSMGAIFIKGLNNWSRIREYRKNWEDHRSGGSWAQEFRENVLPNPALYQDQLIILSDKPYSDVPSEKLGLPDSLWRKYSVNLRLAHECAHLFTLQHYGTIKNHIYDELIADYVGIKAVRGSFDSTWFLHFMGLEDPSCYREGGRFQNYISGLSDDAGDLLQTIVRKASENILVFDSTHQSENDVDMTRMLRAICETGLLSIASPIGSELLTQNYSALQMIA